MYVRYEDITRPDDVMVRRTKEDAEATRQKLLDTAERLFQSNGVSRTSLQDIAAGAGTTRGAIYWHFKDKADMFNAMLERVCLPLEEPLQHVGESASKSPAPLAALRQSLCEAFRRTEHDEQTQRVFEIATLQVEYSGEMEAVKERRLQARAQALCRMEQCLRAEAKRQGLALKPSAGKAAIGLFITVDGVIQNWLLDPDLFGLEQQGRATVDTYLKGLGLSLH